MFRWARLTVLVLLLALAHAHPALAGSRVALVVGEGAYSVAARLDNPPRDADLVRKALEQAGFATVMITDATHPQFQAALRKFRDRAIGADIAVVYYAGHGIEEDGKNWLIPVDARLNSEYDLGDEAIELDRVLESLAGAKLRLVVLDACRNNPFGAGWQSDKRSVKRGLARVEVDDVMVLYAAAPGRTATDGDAANSPFAASLAHRLVQPGLALQLLGGAVRDDVLAATGGAQRPFVSASITGNPIYLVDTSPPPQGAAADHLAQFDRSSLESTLWKLVTDRNTADSYRNYLSHFPSGVFAEEASARLAVLTRSSTQSVLGNAIAPGPANQQPVRGYIGLRIQPLSEDLANSLGLGNKVGEFVQAVDPEGGASKAGVKSGDVVTKIDGRVVNPELTVTQIVSTVAPGKTLRIEVLRDGRRISLNALVGRRPAEADLAEPKPNPEQSQPAVAASSGTEPTYANLPKLHELGMSVMPLSPLILTQLGIEKDVRGLVIAAVEQNSDAAAKGLQRGDIITSANFKPTTSREELDAVVTEAKAENRTAVLLRIKRGDQAFYFPIRLQ